MNLEIREMEEKDIFDTSKVYINSLKTEYEDFIPSDVLKELDTEKEVHDFESLINNSEKFHFILIAVASEEITGFISISSNTVEPFDYDSEINELFVKREFQNTGIGLKLMHSAVVKLKENGYSDCLVYNFHESKSNGFYRQLNGKFLKKIEQEYMGKIFDVDVFGWEICMLKELLEAKISKYHS
jgi:ribosomal protein S18 acetylase RimI-like enzyme